MARKNREGFDPSDIEDVSLDDMIESSGSDSEVSSSHYEDDYVYGDSDELDIEKLGLTDSEDSSGGYGNPNREKKVKGKYDYLLVGDEETDSLEEDGKPSMQERVSSVINKTFDFIESKRFNTFQWVLSLGILIVLGFVIVLLFQASSNLGNNVETQEQSGAKYVAKEVAPEEYDEIEEQEEELAEQQEQFDSYVKRNTQKYERQTEELGEVPEGYVATQDVDGNVTYVSPEEYAEMLNPEVRENTTASDDVSLSEEVSSMEIEIVPADEGVWREIAYTPLADIDRDAVYQSRGELIYFMEKVIALMFAQSVLESSFDTDTYTLSVTLNPDSIYGLPDDFEERMRLAYEESGYQTEAPDQLKIEYVQEGE